MRVRTKATAKQPRRDRHAAVVYARVSSKEQAQGFSIPAQLKLLDEYANSHGLLVVQVFQEAETAKVAGRVAFNAMLAFLSNNLNVGVILAEKTDRLYRNFKDYSALDFETMDSELHLVKENVVLSRESRSNEKMFHAFKVAMSKNYIDNLSEEVVKGQGEKASQGLYPSYAPIGYRNVLEDHTIAPNPTEAPLVRRAFELMATGRYTLQRLRQSLHADGLRSRRAKRMLSKSELTRILTNPIYTGESFIWGGKQHLAKHEPIVSTELFDRVRVALGVKAKPRKTKHSFAFTGLIRCAHCGAAITAERKKQGRYVYYRCSSQCEAVKYLPEAEVGVQLGQAIKRIAMSPEVVEWTREALLMSNADQAEFHAGAIKRLQGRRQSIASYLDQAYQDRVEGRISIELWERKTAEWERERTEIGRQLEAHERAATNYFHEGVKILELAQMGYSLYVSQEPSEQRRLLDVVVSNCRLVGRTIQYDYRKPFDLIADVGGMEEWRGGRDLNDRKGPE